MTISVLGSPDGGDSPLESSGGLLREFRASKAWEAAEQVRQLRIALDYCSVNSPDSIPGRQAATLPGTEGELALAGEGAPGVAEFAVVEFGAVAGLSTDAARLYLGKVLELGHRLPLVWRAVRAGRVPAWRALRIAEHTLPLPPEGAAWVDTHLATIAGKVGPVVLQRLVEEAIVRFDPETAAQRAADALQTRHATLTLDRVLSDLGPTALATGRLDAILDLADALDLDTALADLAADLAATGDTDPLDVRRAKALGLLARGEQPATIPEPDTRPRRPRRRRRVVLHVHLTDAALHPWGETYGDGLHPVTTHTGQPLGLVTVEQVRHWCGSDGTHITVKPVLDLTETLTSSGYQPSQRLRDQITATNPTCVFPHCHRPAPTLDLDHIAPWDKNGPPGQTNSNNLAPLCRRHHRAKTHGHWHYLQLDPGEHLWTSPHGHQFITDTDGTRPVTNRPDLSTGPP